jgi:hypothetical protein
MKVNFTCHTDGKGSWSNTNKAVSITELSLAYVDGDRRCGELRATFLSRSWNVDKYGLIYTDKQWLKEFKNNLVLLGFSTKAAKDISYSEQGMQGDDYVSMDVGSDFINEFFALGGKV